MTAATPSNAPADFSRILRDRELFAQEQGDSFTNRLNAWFDSLLLQSGVPLAPPMVPLLSLFAAVTLGGTVFVVTENPLGAAVAILAGMVAPIAVLMAMRARRQRIITEQLPPMLDELARAAKTGRSIEQCLEMVAADTPDPLGSELRAVVGRLKLGADLPMALADLGPRTGVVSLNVLVTALCVHHQLGGDLVSVLERLAHTVRSRLLFLGRLRAATIAGRATAVLMVVLPVAIFTFFILRDPDYLTKLMAARWGRSATMFAIGLQIVGSVWILRILKRSQQY